MEITQQEKATVVVLNGAVNAKSVDELAQKIMPLVLPEVKVVLDVTAVEFMSSAGLRLLLQLKRASVAVKGELVLVGLTDTVRETMQITGFLQHFTCFATTADALV